MERQTEWFSERVCKTCPLRGEWFDSTALHQTTKSTIMKLKRKHTPLTGAEGQGTLAPRRCRELLTPEGPVRFWCVPPTLGGLASR